MNGVTGITYTWLRAARQPAITRAPESFFPCTLYAHSYQFTKKLTRPLYKPIKSLNTLTTAGFTDDVG